MQCNSPSLGEMVGYAVGGATGGAVYNEMGQSSMDSGFSLMEQIPDVGILVGLNVRTKRKTGKDKSMSVKKPRKYYSVHGFSYSSKDQVSPQL